jgi:hypothetical protein
MLIWNQMFNMLVLKVSKLQSFARGEAYCVWACVLGMEGGFYVKKMDMLISLKKTESIAYTFRPKHDVIPAESSNT